MLFHITQFNFSTCTKRATYDDETFRKHRLLFARDKDHLN